MTIKGRVKVNAGPAPRFARRPVGPSGPGVFFRWALALSLTALAALVAGALATHGLSAALARPPSPPLIAAAGALVALIAIVLPPFFFDRAVTRAYRRLSPGAPSLLAQSLASWAIFALLGACLGAPRQTRAALEAKGAWPLDPTSEGAQRLAGLVRRAVAKLPHSGALESPDAPAPPANEAHASPTTSSPATPTPIASTAAPTAVPIASTAAPTAVPIASTAAPTAVPIASVAASAATPIASTTLPDLPSAPIASAASPVTVASAASIASAVAPGASAGVAFAPFATKLRAADLRLEGDELSSVEKIQLVQVLELLAAATEPCLAAGPHPAHLAFRAESKGPGPQFVADGKPAVTSDLGPEGEACLRKAPAFVHTFVALALGNEHGGALGDGKKLVLSFRLDAPPPAGAGEGAADTTRALVRYELVGPETQWDVDWD